MEKDKQVKNLKNIKKIKSGEIKCNDDVLVKGEGDKIWVAKVKKFCRDKDKVRISWYYMPEDTKFGRLPFQGKNEILYSDHSDTVSIKTIVEKCNVYSEDEYEGFKEVDPHMYLCRSGYDPVKGEFTKDTKFLVYCTCGLPYNPDVPMIQFETCKSWFHPFFVGINTKAELDKIKTFSCKYASSSAS